MHWGWYWKVKKREYIPKDLCSDLPCIDSFLLFKRNERYTFIAPQYQLRAVPGKDCFYIYHGNKKAPSYSIVIEKQRCNYGGYRYYFQCPLCCHRMRKLYLSHGTSLCRKCLNLGYYSQRLRPSKRYEYMRDKIQKLIKTKGGDCYDSKKPQNMRRNTYKRLKHLWFGYDMSADDAFKHEFIEWHGYNLY